MTISSAVDVPKGGLILEKYPEGKQFQKQVMRLSLTSEEILQKMLKPVNDLKIAFGKSMKLIVGDEEYSMMAEKVSEAQQPELYQVFGNKLNFVSTITHTLQIQDDTDDSANESEQKLKDSYDQLNQEKVVASTVLVSDYGLLPPPRNARQFGSLKKASYLKKNKKTVNATGSGPTTPGQIGRSPASMAQSTVESREQQKALRIPMVHLLALGPLTAKSLANKTRAPIELVDKVMPKIAKVDITGRQWILLDDAYKELDVWDFPYMTTNDRDKAIKNAKEAFKRQNLANREEVWFMLIEPDKRDEARRNAISPTPAPSDKEAAERQISLPPPIDASKLAKQAAKPQKAAKAGKQSNLMSRLKAGGKITAPKTKKNPPAAAAAAAVPKAKGSVGRPPKNPAAPKTTKAAAKSTAANNSKIKSAEIITDSDDDADMEDAVTLAPPKPAPKKPSPAPRVTHALPPKPVVSAVPTKQLAEAPRLSPKRKAPASKEPATKSPVKKPRTLANSPEPAYKKAARERAYSPEPVQKSRAPARDYSPEPVKKKNRVPMPPVGTPEPVKKAQQSAASPEPAKSRAYAREHSPEPVKKKNRVPLPPVGTPEPAKKVQQSAAYSPEPAKNKKESRGRDRSPEPTRRRGSFQDSPDHTRKDYRVRDRSPDPARRGRDRSPEPSRRRGSYQESPDRNRVVKEYRVRDRSPESARRGRDRSPEPVKRSKNTSGPRNRSPEPARRQDSQDRAVKRDSYKKSPPSETNGYSNKTANKSLPRPSSQRSDNSSDQKRTPSDRTPSDSRSPSYRGSTDSQSPRDSLNGRGKVQGQQPRYVPAAVNGARRKADRDEPVQSNKPARSASSSGNGSQRDRDSNGSDKGLKRRQDNSDNERPAKRRSVSPSPSAKKPDPPIISRAKQFKEDYAQLREFYQTAQQLPVGSKEEQAAVKNVINLTNKLIAMKKAIWQKSQEEINEQPLSRMGRSESVRAR